MRGVDVLQYSVVNRQPRQLRSAGGSERQPQVVAVDALVDFDGRKLLRATGRAIADRELASQIEFQVVLVRPQFAPTDLAVAIGVEPDCQFAVAHRQLDAAGDAGTLNIERQEAVAGNVSVRGRHPGASK